MLAGRAVPSVCSWSVHRSPGGRVYTGRRLPCWRGGRCRVSAVGESTARPGAGCILDAGCRADRADGAECLQSESPPLARGQGVYWTPAAVLAGRVVPSVCSRRIHRSPGGRVYTGRRLPCWRGGRCRVSAVGESTARPGAGCIQDAGCRAGGAGGAECLQSENPPLARGQGAAEGAVSSANSPDQCPTCSVGVQWVGPAARMSNMTGRSHNITENEEIKSMAGKTCC